MAEPGKEVIISPRFALLLGYYSLSMKITRNIVYFKYGTDVTSCPADCVYKFCGPIIIKKTLGQGCKKIINHMTP